MRLLVLISVLAGGMIAWQEPEEGAAACNNFRDNPHKCMCGKAMMCGRNGHGSGDPDAYKEGPNKCQNFCRKDLCSCLGPCTSRK